MNLVADRPHEADALLSTHVVYFQDWLKIGCLARSLDATAGKGDNARRMADKLLLNGCWDLVSC